MVTPKIIRETVITGKRWLSRYASKVEREAVVKNVYTEVNITPGYFIILTIANLIALCGLITNSIAVIIGAMLISPLMSPILNIGYAFITGDKFVWIAVGTSVSRRPPPRSVREELLHTAPTLGG